MEQHIVFEWLCSLLTQTAETDANGRPSQPSPDEWKALITLTSQHNLLPVLYLRLKEQKAYRDVPDGMLTGLREMDLHSAGRNMRLYHQLAGVLQEFHARNIPVIVLKGAYLAEAVYGNIALRPMCDIDLLVKPADVLHASECLTGLGYQSVQPFWLEGRQTFHDHLPPFMHPERIPIEIHWHLVLPDSPFTVDIEEIWQRAQPVSIAGCQTYGLGPEHLMLYLCLHAAYRHNFAAGLLPLFDLTVLCESDQPAMKWERLISTARQWKAERSLYLGIYFARTLFRAAIPDEVVQAVQPDDITAHWLDQLQARLLNPEVELSRHLLNMWGTMGIREKLCVALKRMFLSPKEIGGMYGVAPGSLRIYLCYPRRIWTLLKHHTYTLWRLARRDPELTAAADDKHAFRTWLTTPTKRP